MNRKDSGAGARMCRNTGPGGGKHAAHTPGNMRIKRWATADLENTDEKGLGWRGR